MKSTFSDLEIQELIQKLNDKGYGDVVDCLLLNENICYTKKDRLNKSATCRQLGWKTKRLEDAFREMKEILKNDISWYHEEEDID